MSDITIVNLTRSYVERNTPDTFVPLGPLYITAALERAGFAVEFKDYLTRGTCVNEAGASLAESVFSFLQDCAPVLGISCVGSMLPAILVAIQRIKALHPEKTIILGGIGAAGVAEELLRDFPYVDIVVKGEGEETIVEVMECIKAGKGFEAVHGISFRSRDRIVANKRRPWIRDLDRIPFPAYTQILFDDYSVIPIISSRGCPYQCAFCDVSPFWGRDNRKRSLDNVSVELELLIGKYGQQRIEFVDDTFTIDKDRVLRFCRLVRQKGWNLSWSCFARVDTIDEEMMENMALSGCVLVFFGLESGSDRVLKRIGKSIASEEAKRVVTRAARYFDVMISFIWGFPFETMEDFSGTLDSFRALSGISATSYLFALNPFPMSRLYREYGHAIEFDRDWGRRLGGLEDQEIRRLVKQYPRVFPGFYRYAHAGFRRKYAVLKEAGLLNTFQSCFELKSDG